MSTWLYLHGRAISRAFAQLLGQPWGTVLSALVVGIALSLPAAGFVLLDCGPFFGAVTGKHLLVGFGQ